MTTEKVDILKANSPTTIAEKASAVVQNPPVAKASSHEPIANHDFLDWLEKLDPTTLVWQVIIIVAIFYFGGVIKSILESLVAKIPQIKNFAGVEFELSEATKSEIEDKGDVLNKEIEPYMVAIGDNPSLLFLNHYIDFERLLDKLYWEAFPNAKDFMRQSPEKMLKDLVHGEFVSQSTMGAFYDIKKIRNELVHGKHAFSDVEEARPYLKAVFLLKDLVTSGLEKLISNKKSLEGLN
jgi:hypothetical protein